MSKKNIKNEKIISVMKKSDLNMNSFCDFVGMPYTTIYNYITNSRKPSLEFLENISTKFNVDMNLLALDTYSIEEFNSYLSNLSVSNHVFFVNKSSVSQDNMSVSNEKMAVNSDKNVTLMSLNSEKPSDNPLLRSTKVDIDIEDYIVVPLYDVYFSAGGGSFLDEETVVDYLLFNKSILNEHPAISKNLAGVKVKGDSMYPTLDDEDVVVIDMDTSKITNIFGGLYALNIDGKAYTKRLAINSQNPKEITIISDNKAHYPEETIPKANLNIIGQIIWHGKFLI